jgi:hypothetical protein
MLLDVTIPIGLNTDLRLNNSLFAISVFLLISYLKCFLVKKKEVKFLPRHINASLCTHAYFAFANIDLDTLSITNFEDNDFMTEGDKPVSFMS